MYVYQEVSSVAPTTSDAGIITNKRSIESSILVDENQIVVLGGLIQDSVNNVQNRVPLLGSLPLIGWLFRYETREHAKTNLMVFIRPYVMYGENSYQSLTEDRYRQMGKTLDNSHLPDSWVLPDDRTKMPPLPAPAPAKPADGARPSSMSEKTRPAP
jgi:general secretion pathway protein D